MGKDFFSERRSGSVENRIPGELPGVLYRAGGTAREIGGSGANGVARQNMLVSRGCLLIPRIIQRYLRGISYSRDRPAARARARVCVCSAASSRNYHIAIEVEGCVGLSALFPAREKCRRRALHRRSQRLMSRSRIHTKPGFIRARRRACLARFI